MCLHLQKWSLALASVFDMAIGECYLCEKFSKEVFKEAVFESDKWFSKSRDHLRIELGSSGATWGETSEQRHLGGLGEEPRSLWQLWTLHGSAGGSIFAQWQPLYNISQKSNKRAILQYTLEWWVSPNILNSNGKRPKLDKCRIRGATQNVRSTAPVYTKQSGAGWRRTRPIVSKQWQVFA